MDLSIPKSMQAVLIEQPGEPPLVGQVPVPQPGPGQVLVRMAVAPINPSDLGFIRGSYGYQKPFPVIPGFEGSGTVVAAGRGLISRFMLGKRVACSAGSGGSWAEYLVTQATTCIPLGKKLSLEQGAMLFVNPMTALAFFNIAKRDHHTALVSNAAASALGRIILHLGQTHRISIIHIVRRPEQVELLRSLGGQYILNSMDPDFPEQLHTLMHQLKATLILDPVAGEQTQQLLDAAPKGSTALVYGSLSGQEVSTSPSSAKNGEKQSAGFFLPDWTSSHPLQTLVNALRVQSLVANKFQTTIQQRLPLTSVQSAIALYQIKPTAGKVLLVADPVKIHLDGRR